MIGYCSVSPGNQGIWVSRTPSMLMKSRLLQITWPKIERISCEMSHLLPFHFAVKFHLQYLQILSGIRGLSRAPSPAQTSGSAFGHRSPFPRVPRIRSRSLTAKVGFPWVQSYLGCFLSCWDLLSLVRCHCAFLEAPGILGHRPWVAWKLWIFAVVDSCPLPVKGFLICCVWKPTRNCFCLCSPMANGVDKKQAVLNRQCYPMGWFVLFMILVMYIQHHSAIFSYNNHNQESQRWTISASSLICSNVIII